MSSDATRKPIAALTCDERVDTSEDAIDWDQVDAIVQSELASLDRAVGPVLESIRVRSGSNHGKSWRLFSYRAFESQPNSGIDPVVVGLTFAAANESATFSISGDISGESLGDVIFEIPRQEAYGLAAVIATARDMC